jgi:hypothetical protein
MKPTALYNKFAGVTAPMLANTSGTFNIPGFAPIKSFPFPGLTVGNASQIDGLLPGSGRADMIAANIYRVQDRRDDAASGLGVTGLGSASKGNASGRSINLTSPDRPIVSPTPPPIPPRLFTPAKVKPERTLDQIEAEQEQARQRGLRAGLFMLNNPGLGESRDQPLDVSRFGAPIAVPGRQLSQRPKIQTTIFSPSS